MTETAKKPYPLGSHIPIQPIEGRTPPPPPPGSDVCYTTSMYGFQNWRIPVIFQFVLLCITIINFPKHWCMFEVLSAKKPHTNPAKRHYIEDITYLCMDMNFIFKWSSSWTREDKFISTSGHVIFCLLYNHTNDDFFDDFLKISEHFPKILENLCEGQTIVSEHFPKISEDYWRLQKITEDFRGRTDDVLITE